MKNHLVNMPLLNPIYCFIYLIVVFVITVKPVLSSPCINPFAAEFSKKNAVFLLLNQFFGCDDSKLALILTKK